MTHSPVIMMSFIEELPGIWANIGFLGIGKPAPKPVFEDYATLPR